MKVKPSLVVLPLVPPKCDLSSYPYLAIEVNNFSSSHEWITFSYVEKVAFLNLLLKSWHQIPCSSLPNDDVLLKHFSGVGQKWGKIKENVLSKWVLASDERYYHPYVAKRALEAWLIKLNASLDANKGNEKRWNVSIDSSELSADLGEALQCLRILNPTSKTLESHVLKAIFRANKHIDNYANLSGAILI
ncbi:DUF1376 domain-containing protein [Acinetobacter faecalis]|uniref:DUF1376 domain-containing protein n=1 Tax=Acinetobacter faecalis TaxID=2665161 RepID=UPI002A919AE0|nr:DUF1376 domain-containing protein [Acinetobacter faecalis]MDY6451444.1 DUF1376 domain-containing protein [Acinetobacter faecalis]